MSQAEFIWKWCLTFHMWSFNFCLLSSWVSYRDNWYISYYFQFVQRLESISLHCYHWKSFHHFLSFFHGFRFPQPSRRRTNQSAILTTNFKKLPNICFRTSLSYLGNPSLSPGHVRASKSSSRPFGWVWFVYNFLLQSPQCHPLSLPAEVFPGAGLHSQPKPSLESSGRWWSPTLSPLHLSSSWWVFFIIELFCCIFMRILNVWEVNFYYYCISKVRHILWVKPDSISPTI